MPFSISIDDARRDFPQYEFVEALTPSEFKAAFHVKDASGSDLCLKIINPSSELSRVKREIVALQQLSHPNLARLVEYTYSSKQGHQTHFLVEEYVGGSDLSEKLGVPWQSRTACVFFLQLFAGLSELKRKQLVHRDLKPNNIRVRLDGSPVIVDFGLVRHLGLPDLTQTADGAAIGTPRYFAPEQCKGTKHDIDHRTDLFAAGVLMYETLTAQHPFYHANMTIQELYDSICEAEDWRANSTLGSLPMGWQLLIERLLSKERADRPFDADQVCHVLGRIGGGV
ncbi:serine/threonine protein kinase [bacterium]|nr:serine/threonine protein kinase [bacterium]MCB2202152.1 serine/threonine protein kinase [bacterium]